MKRRSFLLGCIALPLVTKASEVRLNLTTGGGTKPSSPSPSTSLDLSRLLAAIAQVETGNDDSKVGKDGERSRYQISRDVWHDRMEIIHTDFGIVTYYYSFYLNCHGQVATTCATRHLEWLVRSSSRTTPFWLAYAWKAGLSWVDRPEVNITAHKYATRVENLYNDARS